MGFVLLRCSTDFVVDVQAIDHGDTVIQLL